MFLISNILCVCLSDLVNSVIVVLVSSNSV